MKLFKCINYKVNIGKVIVGPPVYDRTLILPVMEQWLDVYKRQVQYTPEGTIHNLQR